VFHSRCDIQGEQSVDAPAYDDPVSEWNSVRCFIHPVMFCVNGLLVQ
jgi:hypothetical protein